MAEPHDLVAAPARGSAELVHATSDERLLELWLHGRPETTQQAYRFDVGALLAHVGRPLREMTIGDVQGFATSIEAMAPASRRRKLAAVKSLMSFGLRLGYLQVDVGRAIRLPPVRDRLAEKILLEAEVLRLIQLEPDARNHALLNLVYRGGLRVSEGCALRWRDLQAAKSGGQATLYGKGGKTRAVIIQPKLWRQLRALRGAAGDDAPVFATRSGQALDRSQAHRIIKAAARRAGVTEATSMHWLRHAHASHSLDYHAPLHVLQQSLGHASLTTTSHYVHARPGDGSAKYIPE